MKRAPCPRSRLWRCPNGVTHFVIVWRRFGRFVELMDPAVGRRWVSAARFLSDLYLHQQPVAAEDWREYAGSEDFLAPLRSRLHLLGIDNDAGRSPRPSMIQAGNRSPRWTPPFACSPRSSIRAPSSAVPKALACSKNSLRGDDTIPEHYWSVRPDAEDGQLVMRGAVLVRALGVAPDVARTSPELLAALQQPSARPGIELLRLLGADGVFTPVAIAVALALAAAR